jgi:hypothetical protein
LRALVVRSPRLFARKHFPPFPVRLRWLARRNRCIDRIILDKRVQIDSALYPNRVLVQPASDGRGVEALAKVKQTDLADVPLGATEERVEFGDGAGGAEDLVEGAVFVARRGVSAGGVDEQGDVAVAVEVVEVVAAGGVVLEQRFQRKDSQDLVPPEVGFRGAG